MLVSRRHNIAFAHYPKTAGSSLQTWFFETFPDAELLVPENPHLDVASSLQRLLSRDQRRHRIVRYGLRSLGMFAPSFAERGRQFPLSLRVVGALRDPFEMLVSLFEYWKRDPFDVAPTDPFIRCALTGTFHDFVAAAVVGSRIAPYERFFNVGGPLWPNTYLLDFESIDSALDRLCDMLGIANTHPLPALNRAPGGGRDMARYRDEAGPLVAEVRRYFRWYHEEGVHRMIRGEHRARAAA